MFYFLTVFVFWYNLRLLSLFYEYVCSMNMILAVANSAVSWNDL